jgi:N-acetylmuramoyl-L-alanine amidase
MSFVKIFVMCRKMVFQVAKGKTRLLAKRKNQATKNLTRRCFSMTYSIKHNRLKVGGKLVTSMPSPFSSGPFSETPKVVVLHYTSGNTAESTAGWFQHPDNPGASAHLVIDRDGKVIQCLDFDQTAWHCGESQWRDITGLNKHAIGIELANWGQLVSSGSDWKTHTGKTIAYPVMAVHENGNPDGSETPMAWEPFPEVQVLAAAGVVRALVKEYGINVIVGHDDISKGRKWDPGPAFNKQHFRKLVFGCPTEAVSAAAKHRPRAGSYRHQR